MCSPQWNARIEFFVGKRISNRGRLRSRGAVAAPTDVIAARARATPFADATRHRAAPSAAFRSASRRRSRRRACADSHRPARGLLMPRPTCCRSFRRTDSSSCVASCCRKSTKQCQRTSASYSASTNACRKTGKDGDGVGAKFANVCFFKARQAATGRTRSLNRTHCDHRIDRISSSGSNTRPSLITR